MTRLLRNTGAGTLLAITVIAGAAHASPMGREGIGPATGTGQFVAYLSSDSELTVVDLRHNTTRALDLTGERCALGGGATRQVVVSCTVLPSGPAEVSETRHQLVTLATLATQPLPGAASSRELEDITAMGTRWVRGAQCSARCVSRVVNWHTGRIVDAPAGPPGKVRWNLDATDPRKQSDAPRQDAKSRITVRAGGKTRILDGCSTGCSTPVTSEGLTAWLASVRGQGYAKVRMWTPRTRQVRTLSSCSPGTLSAVSLAANTVVVSRRTAIGFAYCSNVVSVPTRASRRGVVRVASHSPEKWDQLVTTRIHLR